MIVLDANLHELGEIETDIDIEYGTSEDSTNDFEVTDAQMRNVGAGGFYIPGTEIGGLFDYVKINVRQNECTRLACEDSPVVNVGRFKSDALTF